MSEYGKVAILENDIEAQLLGQILTEEGIDHILRTYHDFAYDGLFQFQKGWGEIRAPGARRDEIVDILAKIRI